MGTDIPKARQELRAIAKEIHDHAPFQAKRIHDICDNLMTRSGPTKRLRAPNTSNPISPEIHHGILYELKTTDKSNAQIASEFGVNPGRVSEILNETIKRL